MTRLLEERYYSLNKLANSNEKEKKKKVLDMDGQYVIQMLPFELPS